MCLPYLCDTFNGGLAFIACCIMYKIDETIESDEIEIGKKDVSGYWAKPTGNVYIINSITFSSVVSNGVHQVNKQ